MKGLMPTLYQFILKSTIVSIFDLFEFNRYRSTVGSYNSGAVGALVVYDVSQRKTFENVTTFIEELRERCNPNLVIVLVGNKVDSDNRAVSTVEAESFAETHHIFFMETSAMLFTTVENAFTKLFTEIFGVVSAQKLHPPHIPTDMPAEEVHEDTEGSENVEETRNSGACCPL